MPHRITGGTPDNWKIIEGETFDEGAFLAGSSGSYVRLLDCTYRNPAGLGLDIRDGAHDIEVLRGTAFDCGVQPDWSFGGVSVRNGGYGNCRVTIAEMEIHHCKGAGVNVEGNADRGEYTVGVEVRDCRIHDIEPRKDEQSHELTGAGILFTSCGKCYALYNKIHDVYWSALHADCKTRDGLAPLVQCYEIYFIGNSAWKTGRNIAEFEGAINSVMRGNIFKGGAGLSADYCGAVCLVTHAAGNTIEWNVFTDEKGGYSGPIIDIRENATDNTIDHNTIYAPSVNEIGLSMDDAAAMACRITSNLWVHAGRTFWMPVAPAPAHGLVRAHNFVHLTHLADRVFVDPAAYDLRLKPGSPCIGAGSGGSDIGALAFVKKETDVIQVKKTVQVELTAYGKVDYDAEDVPHVYECDENGTIKGVPIGDFDIRNGKLVVLPVE